MLYDIGATDPEIYAGIVVIVALVTIVACGGPSLRAAGIDPVEALREQ